MVSTVKWIVITKVICTVIVIRKQITAICSEVNLRIFMQATIMHTETMSFTIQFLLENHHPRVTAVPISKLASYRTRNFNNYVYKSTFLSIFSLNKKRVSLAHIATPQMPTTNAKI